MVLTIDEIVRTMFWTGMIVVGAWVVVVVATLAWIAWSDRKIAMWVPRPPADKAVERWKTSLQRRP